jgi:hypothetical protein
MHAQNSKRSKCGASQANAHSKFICIQQSMLQMSQAMQHSNQRHLDATHQRIWQH